MARALLTALGLLGCADPDAVMRQCNGPLWELVGWRDRVGIDLHYERGGWTPETLAAEEKRRVEETVAALMARRDACDRNWEMLMFQAPTSPGLRLREEALLQVFGAAPHDYPPESVGYAGVTVAGRPPVVGLELR